MGERVKLDVYSIMYNESRILPYWLRHYEQYASHIFVWDGGSTDGTREMLEAHPLVTVFDQECKGLDDNYFTACFMQYRQLSREADWCMAIAADEFIYHRQLAVRLEELIAKGPVKVQLHGFTMYAETFPQSQGQIYDEIKYGYPDIWSTKTVLFSPQLEMQWRPGLHIETSGDKPLRNSGIKLLHYRYLGADYYLDRVKRNYARWRTAGINVEFDYHRPHNLPDGSRGNPYEWYEINKNKLMQVVE